MTTFHSSQLRSIFEKKSVQQTALLPFSFVALSLLLGPCTSWSNPSVGSFHARVTSSGKSDGSKALHMIQVWLDGRGEDGAGVLCLSDLEETPDVILCSQNHDTAMEMDIPSLASSDDQIFDPSLSDGKSPIGIIIDTTDSPEIQKAVAAMGSVEWILVNATSDWKMIPAENLIASAQSSGTRLAFCVNRASDVGGLARALELGVDALCVPASADASVWQAVFRARTERRECQSTESTKSAPDSLVVDGTCWRRDTKGEIILADRVCIDFVQTLLPEEGIWVGSSAKMLALVLSEAAASSYVPTRPFRVNAGPVHSYVLMEDGSTTKYLCEVRAADKISVYNSKTQTSRSVAVGRLKQETRPCVLVELEASVETQQSSRTTGQVFLQQAETVRLGRSGGETFVRVTDLEAQEEVGHTAETILIRTQSKGTHIGKAYAGRVTER